MSAGQRWRGTLTPRQAEVVELVALGLHDREISERLGITPQTVKFHLFNARLSIPSPSGSLSRVQLARWWWENVELPGREG